MFKVMGLLPSNVVGFNGNIFTKIYHRNELEGDCKIFYMKKKKT